ncbi:hypothetical protein CHH92_18755 [Bacillus sonorensis]|uniref:Uncharacterized protein n=1 Tax=Bacillus sonorensis L12 TaxID=1274524 RepID=M5PGQ7_9BACI|nr:hypothetical protein BSONL12_05898 [Bacillus sonorensis L12]PAD58880.1 hypothetical protein CHH92_18755 [Bacillus sonorensis]RHJ06712.1 hypothetical protein DW143_20295 [Bacillus sonorensis]GIN68164.1 hypothetical protein J41TS2_35850 [Bacillus sonorensis]
MKSKSSDTFWDGMTIDRQTLMFAENMDMDGFIFTRFSHEDHLLRIGFYFENEIFKFNIKM